MEETTQTTPKPRKKARRWWILAAIALLVIIIIVRMTRDDGSLPSRLKGRVGETKKFECYYIEATYQYDRDKAISIFLPTDYLCKVYIGPNRHDAECVYLHITAKDFERAFGPEATSAAGSSGEIVDSGDLFARRYDKPIQITATIIDADNKALSGGAYSASSDFKSKSGKTKLMDFQSVSP